MKINFTLHVDFFCHSLVQSRRHWVAVFLLILVPSSNKAQVTSIDVVEITQRIDPTDISFKMVLVPEGSFFMGVEAKGSGQEHDNGPKHKVFVDSLWVGKYEVTWEMFELFLSENKVLFRDVSEEKLIILDAITRPSRPFDDPSLGMGKEGYPVVNVSPHAALVFCKWLSSVTGKFYRLPTEAEWEYFCKSPNNEHEDFFKGISADIGDYAWSYENSDNQYAKVGQKLPNGFGLFDVLGNVAEWTLDQYDKDFYKKEQGTVANNPWNVPTKIHPRVFRGGSWEDDAKDLSSTKRGKSGSYLQKNDPQIPKSYWWYTDSPFIGFRIVSPVNQPTKEEREKFWKIALDK